MAHHDAWLRLTPYELALPGRAFVDRHFPVIGEEAEARGVDPADPDRFVLLASAGAALREIRGEEEEGERILQHGALLFHAWHFWRERERIHLLTTSAMEALLDEALPEGLPPPALPSGAGYVQFPQHLVWARAGEGDRPESLDGFFWTRSAAGNLSALLVAGIHRERAGFSVVEVPPLPFADVGAWAGLKVREGEPDFAPTLPGGELAGLRSVETGGEVLKLVGRVLRRLGPGEGEEERSPPEEEVGPGGPIPSRLPWRRVE